MRATTDRRLLLLLILTPCRLRRHVESLKTFLNETTHGASARFAQIVLDQNGKPLQQATGTLAFFAPGQVPLGVRQARRPDDRRRRHARCGSTTRT